MPMLTEICTHELAKVVITDDVQIFPTFFSPEQVYETIFTALVTFLRPLTRQGK